MQAREGLTLHLSACSLLTAAGVHMLLPSCDNAGPVFVSYIAMQSLGASLWRICHPRHSKKQTLTAAPASDEDYRRWVVHTGKGMLRVRLPASNKNACNQNADAHGRLHARSTFSPAVAEIQVCQATSQFPATVRLMSHAMVVCGLHSAGAGVRARHGLHAQVSTFGARRLALQCPCWMT